MQACLIAVMAFLNHGPAPRDTYFVDGIVDDIRAALSRFRSFAVVSRGASLALGEKGADTAAAAAHLGIRYLLEGSIRRFGGRLRVSAHLIEVASGAHLWAERYEGTLADVFSFEDRITQSVVGVIEPTIRKAEIERARRTPAANLGAYDLFLRALPLISAPRPDGYLQAIALLEKALERDPGFAIAAAHAAWIYEKRISLRLPTIGPADHDNCIALSRRALAAGGDDPLVRAICGWVLYRVARDVPALEGLRAAAAENPNSVVILNLAGVGNQVAGAPDEAFRCRSRAWALSPGAPDAYQSLHGMAAAEMMRGNYEAAVGWCLKSLATFNDWIYTWWTLAASYAYLDRMDEAAAAIQRVRELNPDLTIASFEQGTDPCDDAYGWAVIPGLRKAGLPER
jgi:TolB-like protein